MGFDRRAPTSLLIVAITLSAGLVVAGEGAALAQQKPNHWSFEVDAGLWAETSDNERLAFNVNLDYYVEPLFSFGWMTLFTTGGDLTQVAFAPVARWHVPWRAIKIAPLIGFGGIYGDLDEKKGGDSDWSIFIPVGIGAEYPVSKKLALASTLYLNFHDLSLEKGEDNDFFSLALMFGVRFGP